MKGYMWYILGGVVLFLIFKFRGAKISTKKTEGMRTTEGGRTIIKRHEGLKLNVYNDQAGHPTIGYVHKLLPSEIGLVNAITLGKAEEYLTGDLKTAEDAVNKLVEVPLNQNQFDALVSFVYNVGAGSFQKSTMLALLNEGNYKLAAEEFPRWNRAGGKVSNGLTNRREQEKRLFLL